MEPISIILVDDHKIVRDGIKALLLGQKKIKCIGDTGDADGLSALLKNGVPDILLLDLQLPGKCGIEIARDMQEKFPSTGILILSSKCDEASVLNSVRAGARGFLPKDTSRAELILAIETLASGGEYFGETIRGLIYKSFVGQVQSQSDKNNSCLSDREIEILILIAEGYTNKEIADQLCISPRTIDTHKSNIMLKLKLNSTADLVKYAIRQGYIRL